MRDFYRFRMMIRDPTKDYNILFRGGRLFQQYCVDQWAKIHQYELNFIRRNQKKLKADLYSGLQDAIRDDDLPNAGKRVILPSTHTGSPRWFNEKFRDAMAIVRYYKNKPDFFITFTCNPKWREITDELLPGQSSVDRPELTSRVFRMKLKELMHDLVHNQVLGATIAYMYTIEFQKRGLPHAHILLILRSRDKLHRADQYDKVVCAEIPNPAVEPELFQLVTKHMIHNPCGPHTNESCMRGGQCIRNYPKEFRDRTCATDDGYPRYRRLSPEQGGMSFTKERLRQYEKIDNRWVVPYNAHLLWKYGAHINVEFCGSFAAIKYLYKYIYKGPDRATIEFHVNDEVTQYLDSLYIGANEACWKINKFKLHDRKPAVTQLALHLENGQRVTYPEDESKEGIEQIMQNSDKTTLIQWMKNNEKEFKTPLTKKELLTDKHGNCLPEGAELLYHEYPEYYTWSKSKKKWKRRTHRTTIKNRTIGRMYTAHPIEGERWFLRLCLLYIPGAKRWEDLRTWEGHTYNTYYETCKAMGILEEDDEWHKCLTDAALMEPSGSKLRALFAAILVFCNVKDHLDLWNKHKDDLSEDFLHEARKTAPNLDYCQDIYDLALQDIAMKLKLHKKTLKHYRLPEPICAQNLTTEYLAEKNYNRQKCKQKADENYDSMNDQQKYFYHTVLNSMYATNIDHNQSNIFFLDALGGTGKTFVMETLLASIRSKGDIAIACAFSGIAALLLEGGRTLHSRFKLPLEIHEGTVSSISRRSTSSAARIIRECKCVILDEAPMANRQIFECLDRSLRDICNNEQPFGGKTMILCGDFRQILPIVKHGSRVQIVNATINRSHLWEQVQQFHLNTNERVKRSDNADQTTMQEFADTLEQIGDGTYPIYSEIGEDMIKIPNSWLSKSTNIEEFIEEIFPDIETRSHETDFVKGRAILTPKNVTVDEINKIILNKMPGEATLLQSIDRNVEENMQSRFSIEELWNNNPDGFPQHNLLLKRNAIIMLLRNLDPSNGACNGTRFKVLSFTEHVIRGEIITKGDFQGNIFLIPRISLRTKDTETIPMVRTQFPVRLAYAMTINKAQGQTLQMMGLYLPEPVFSHGHLYVACGRVGSADNLSLLIENTDNQGEFYGHEGIYTRNVVFKEVFSNKNIDEQIDIEMQSSAYQNYTDIINSINEEDEKMSEDDQSDNEDEIQNHEIFNPNDSQLQMHHDNDNFKCSCNKKLIYVQNDQRNNEFDLYDEYICDKCDQTILPRQMVYHCSNYSNHEVDYHAKCLHKIMKKDSGKEEAD